MLDANRDRWMMIAESLAPKLTLSPVPVEAVVRLCEDAAAFHGWKAQSVAPASALGSQLIEPGGEVCLDFGRHIVGRLEVTLAGVTHPGHAEAVLSVRFGEVAAEIGPSVVDKTGKLGGEWLESVPLRVQPGGAVMCPTRRAFRYARVRVEEAPGPIRLAAARVVEESAVPASVEDMRLCRGPADLIEIDAVSLRTLRNCMQGVFEDGPKRDRRLWLGDLRLQALANYVSFRDMGLVKRCLYLFAACAYDDGVIPACVYERPRWHAGTEFIPDYSLLFGPTLLDYLEASGDMDTARDLWPIALRQTEVLRRFVDSDGLFVDPGDVWLFIDWHEGLDRQAAEQGTALYALEKLQCLGRRVGADAATLTELSRRYEQMSAAARTRLWDAKQGLFVSGKARQVSWASHVWLTLGGALSDDEARAGFDRLSNAPNALRPVTPYLHHHVIEAMFACGLGARASGWLRDYWGGMLRHDATTFWEVYDPEQPMLSPYASIRHNSYCHAWSCTPACFIRRGLLDPYIDAAESMTHAAHNAST